MSAKIGVLRHSFNEWGEARNNRKTVIEQTRKELIRHGTDPQIAKRQARQETPSVFTSLGYGKAGLKAQMMDVPQELTDKQASRIVSTLDRIKNSGKDVSAETQKYISFLNSKGITGVGKYVAENDKLPSTMQGVQKSQKDARDAAIAHNEELGQLTLGAKAANLSMKALSMAGNMLLAMGVSWAISKVVEGIAGLVHAAENAREKTKELADEAVKEEENIESLISQYNKLDKTDRSTENTEKIKSLNEEINKALGTQAENIDLVNGKLDEQSDKLKRNLLQKLQDDKGDIDSNVAVSSTEYDKGISFGTFGNDTFGGVAKALYETGIDSWYKDAFYSGVDAKLYSMSADEQLAQLKEWRDLLTKKYNETGDYGDEVILLNNWYDELSTKKDTRDKALKEQQLRNEKERVLNDWDSGKIANIEAFEIYRKEIQETYKENSTLQNQMLDFIDNIFPEFAKKLQETKQTANTVSNVATQSTPFTKKNWDAISDLPDDDTNKPIKEAQSALQELAKQGKLTIDAFNKTGNHDTILDHFNIKADEAVEKINKLVDESQQLSSLKSGIQSIRDAYGEKKDDKKVGADTLAGMEETFGGLGRSWDNYKQVLGTASSTLEQCKKAQNDLATAYVNSNNFLSQLTDSNKDYYISQLDELGIANSRQVVQDALNMSKVDEIMLDWDVSKATLDEVNAKYEEIGALENCTQAVKNYAFQKALANKDALTTSESVTNLMALAEQCGITGEAIELLKRMKKNFDKLNKLDANGQYSPDIASNIEYDNKGLADRIKKLAKKKVKVKTGDVDVSTKGTGTKKDKDKGKDKSKSKTVIDWIERALTRISSKLDLIKSKYDNLVDVKKLKTTDDMIKARNKNLDEQLKILKKTEKYQKQAEKNYNKKAKSVKLNSSLKKAVQEGRIKGSMKDLIAAYGEKTADNIQKYQDWYDKAQEQKKAVQETKAAKRENRSKKYQNFVDDADAKISLAEQKKENADTAASKNKQLESEKAQYKESYKYQKKIAGLSKDKTEQSRLEAEYKAKIREINIEQHQNLADEHQTALDNLSAQKELTATAAEKNAIIEQEKAATASLYGEKIAIAQLEGNSVEAAKLQYELQKQQRDFAVEQHQNLADEYQANIDLSQAEQDRTKTANDKNSIINKEAEQTKLLYEEKLAIAQLEGNAVEAQKLQIVLQGELLALEQKKFDNISQYYDNIRTNTDNTLSDLDNQIAQMEARGITASAGLYKSKLETENKLRDILEAKRTELEEEHKAMEEETPEWYSQKKAIQEIENQISKCTQNMSGYLSSIREAKNELRELYKTIENINNGAVDNASTYLSRYELTDDDIGGLTEKGIAQLGIYRSQIENAKANQQTDMEHLSELAGILNEYDNAWDGAKQIQYLEQFNFGSIEDVVKEYNEYSEKVQSDISERISGEENIISLMKERYDAELAFIKKLVDARKTLLSEEKDLYDFQKNVREKVENISSLEKQIAALSGDGSEEAKMKRQQLQSQLDDAKEDLMDVEYDRYISDQTTILDDLYEKYETAIGDMLQDVDTLLNDGNEIARGNGEKLQSILDNFVDKYNDPTTDTKEIVKKMEDGSPLPSNVSNTKTNTDAIKEMLQQEQADNDAAQAVMSLINAIGEIGYNPESMNSIYNARTAYDALTTQQKAIVDANGGLKALNQKETDFNNSVAKYNDDVKRQQEAEQAQAQLQAQQAEEAKNAEKRNAFEQMIKETYWQDARLHGGKLRWGTEKLGDGDYGTVQKKIHDMGISRVDKPYVNANWIKEACNRLGYSRPESQNAGTLLNYMNSIGYSSGGVVDNLVKVPGRNGDDGWGTLKLGEYVLKPLDSSTFQDFVGKMEPFNLMMDHMMENVTKNIPTPVPTLASQLTPVEIGDINITLDGTNVVDKDSLIRTMQTDRKTQQVMKEVVWDKIAGRGSLNVRRL